MKNNNVVLGVVIAVVLVVSGLVIWQTQSSRSANKSSNSSSSTAVSTTSIGVSSSQKTVGNPGTEITSPDKGKSVSTDTFKYTLLEVRKDSDVPVTALNFAGGDVYLIKLEVERIAFDGGAQDRPTGTSLAEVSLVADEATPDRGDNKTYKKFDWNVTYDRSKIGVDLAGDVTSLGLGEKVTGYYVYNAGMAHEKAYFAMYTTSGMSVEKGEFNKLAGVFQIK